MAGIYIHIPFCKSRCKYCDFYSTTRLDRLKLDSLDNLKSLEDLGILDNLGYLGNPDNLDNLVRLENLGLQSAYAEAICREMELRRDFLQGEPVKTLYFGGGTPSQLSPSLLAWIIRKTEQTFGFDTLEELTIEANPDDLTANWIDDLIKAVPQYKLRISMGIQTFNDDLLQLLGRRHTAQEAIDAVHRLQTRGITEISIDLMYGLPARKKVNGDYGKNEKDGNNENYETVWLEDLEKAVGLGVPHISAYHLSYEEGTPLYRMRERGEVREADEEESLRYFRQLRHTLLSAGYRHYEISNFALPGHEARHNSNYWNGIPYLGLGPGAHSYDGKRRTWNHPDLPRYLEVLCPNLARKTRKASKTSPAGITSFSIIPQDIASLSSGETLSDEERYNEYIMTRLRTAHGISPQEIKALFGKERERYCSTRARTYLKSHRIYETTDGRWILTEDGIFVSDAIIADLFY